MECEYCGEQLLDGDEYFEYENEIYCEECFDINVKECFRKTTREENYNE